ncbi:MAG: hypothetical protein AB7V27_16230 [Candidatus Binatia bacterium]
MLEALETEDESANWNTTDRTLGSDIVFRQKAAPFGITRDDLKKKRLSARRFFALYESVFEPLKQKYASQPYLTEADPTTWTEEQWMKQAGQLWAIENHVTKTMAVWLMTLTKGPHGEFLDVQRMLVRQMYEEHRHMKVWEDTFLKKGWVRSRYDMYELEVCRPNIWTHNMYAAMIDFPGLHYNPAVLAAGQHYPGEDFAGDMIMYIADNLKDPDLARPYEVQTIEEKHHSDIGKYIIWKYADSPEVQELCLWWGLRGLESIRHWALGLIEFLYDKKIDAPEIEMPVVEL